MAKRKKKAPATLPSGLDPMVRVASELEKARDRRRRGLWRAEHNGEDCEWGCPEHVFTAQELEDSEYPY